MSPKLLLTLFLIGLVSKVGAQNATTSPQPSPTPIDPALILTPPAAPAPRLNNPRVFGARPGNPFLYSIPATGVRPMTFTADRLPAGLTLDAATGRISGSVQNTGEFDVTLHAKNSVGQATKNFKIKIGEEIALTPPMGWNSWNCWHMSISQEKILSAARGIVKSGLDRHGWTYVNIDDTWQGVRGGPFNAIQPDPKSFPNIAALSAEVHGMGLKLGIYSSPWVTSYDGHCGGSSEDPKGVWERATMSKGENNKKILPRAIGRYHFFTNDVKQWVAWNVDYVKFDWAPIELPETKEMSDALRVGGRDIVLSLSNNATNTLFGIIGDISKYVNSWRLDGDIGDSWRSIKDQGFNNDKWAPYSRPGHWNDPDMFEVGTNGGGQPKKLTPDEQYLHVSQWCLLSAPMLLGCDMEHMDDFTVALLSNDEVIEIDQDTLGKQATCVAREGDLRVFAKPLDDGTWAVGLFNLGETASPVTVAWSNLKISGPQKVRDLWRQNDLGVFPEKFEGRVAPHGVLLVKVSPQK